jgi:hypothetical protein
MLGNDEVTINVHDENGAVKQYKVSKRYKILLDLELQHYQQLSGLE